MIVKTDLQDVNNIISYRLMNDEMLTSVPRLHKKVWQLTRKEREGRGSLQLTCLSSKLKIWSDQSDIKAINVELKQT